MANSSGGGDFEGKKREFGSAAQHTERRLSSWRKRRAMRGRQEEEEEEMDATATTPRKVG
jgi:hypothetical protein